MKKELELAVQPAPSNQIEKVTEQILVSHLENLGLLKDLTKGEKDTYIQICKAYNLNPFKREIHVSKFNNVMSIITGYETYIKRAERSGLLDGWEVRTEGTVKDGTLKAIITIYRKDRSRPFNWEVNYSEYVQRNSSGGPNKFWQKAETMTKKVAMAQGFRLCFNDELGGMPYTSDEMPEVTQDVQHVEVVPAPVAVEVKPTQGEIKAAIATIKLATTLDELRIAYTALTPEMKAATLTIKDEMKAKLTPVIIAEKVEGALLLTQQ